MAFLRIALAFLSLLFLESGLANSVAPKSTPASSLGTGFSVTKDGYILTSAQLVDSQPLITVKNPSGSFQRRARLVGIDRKLDLALLKIDAQTVEIPIGNSDTAVEGQQVILLGFSSPINSRASPTATSGIINPQTGAATDNNSFSVSTTGQSGDPGRPILSMSGSIVGVVYGFAAETSSSPKSLAQTTYAVTAQQLKRFIDRQQVKYTTETTATSPLQVSELLQKYEGSIFLIDAGANDLSVFKGRSLKKRRANDEVATEYSEKLRGLLKTLPEREQPRLFGAYKAGYDLIEEWDDSYLLIKSESRASGNDSVNKIVKFDSIISYKKERALSSGEAYLSAIMTARFDCSALMIEILRQEFKPEAFGSGTSILAKKKIPGEKEQWSAIKSDLRRNTLKTMVCGNDISSAPAKHTK